MGRFFNGKVKKDRTSLIKYCVIGVGVLIIIILLCAIGCRPTNNYNDLFKLKEDGVTIELGDYVPEATEFFEEIDDYPFVDKLKVEYDTEKCDTNKIGECDITITGIDIDPFATKLYIKDTTAPELELKEAIQIDVNQEYTADDFVYECYDNTDSECKIYFYTEATDENGEPIDYSLYKNNGTYKIQIVAEDESGNKSKPQESELIIGTGIIGDMTCSYGNLTVSPSRVKFPIAVIVGDEYENCAIDRNLWDSVTTQVPANDLYTTDYNRLKDQMGDVLKKNFPKGANIKVYPNFISVLNDSLTGLVGYGIYVKVYVAEPDKQIDLDENLVMSYYINSDGSRLYTTNKYKIDE